MLSWQLSQLQSAPATNQRRGQKDRERRRRRSSNEAGGEEEGVGPSDDIAGEDGGDSGECGEEGREEGGFAYLVVNSDGEEECYYSAPESPSLSEDDGKRLSCRALSLAAEFCVKRHSYLTLAMMLFN